MVEHPPLRSLWQEPGYAGHRWGMTIDLSKCIGCGACVVACQAENNIPVVGKEQVLAAAKCTGCGSTATSAAPADRPQVVFQPVACMHCEMAPCEDVCPVAATVHSAEGLNEMVYNRCVGTRYLLEQLPVQSAAVQLLRLSQGPGQTRPPRLVKMANNPDVTVRSRGVMEKCTYCVQRIQRAKIEAKNERPPIADGEILTACQQACPTQAITFGDLADAASSRGPLCGGRPRLCPAGRVERAAAHRVPGADQKPQSGT